MQMTMDQAMRPGAMAFAMRRSGGYVMRSEKRPGYGSAGGNGRGPKKPRRASGFYIFMTVLIAILLWPVGMVMLWRKKVRLQTGTKLLISLLTMCLSVFLIVFMLTVHVDNAQFTDFQDRANDWLNKASADLAVAGDAAYKQGVETWGVMTEFANNAIEPAANTVADGMDWTVARATEARAFIEGRLGLDSTVSQARPSGDKPAENADGGEAASDAIVIRVPGQTPEPDGATPLVGGLLRSDGTLVPGATPEPTATPEATEASEDTLSWTAMDDAILRNTPGIETNKADATAATRLAAAEVESAEDANAAAEQTLVPEMTVRVKPAGEATVYYNDTGRSYHMRETCKQMSGAKPHTLAEAVAAGKVRCDECGSPDPSILEVAGVAWVDDYNTFHTTDACAKFQGGWKLMSLEDVLKGGYIACAACQANLYAVQGPDSAVSAEKASVEETPVPAENVVTPAVALKPAGDATVYHSSNGKFYHRFIICKGMTGSKPYKLSEIGEAYRRCNTCEAPDRALIGVDCLWMDSNKLCHTSDTCKKFRGDYTLVPRDDALAQGRVGCTECGADEYLIPGTVIAPAN